MRADGRETCIEPLCKLNVPSDFFGMTYINKFSVTIENTGALAKGTFINWPYLEVRPGSYSWSNLDGWVSASERIGVDFYYSFKAVPAWAARDPSACEPSSMPGVMRCASMPRDLALFDEFVTKLVTRYKGRIKFYELWNEPEYDLKIAVQDMVELTNHAHDIIRRIDPAAKIISPSLNGRHADYADRYFAAGGTRDVDVVSLHTYTGTQTNHPETIDPGYRGPGALVAPILPILRKYGLDQKPLWSTEGAWSDRPNSLPDRQDQAAFVARALLLHWSSGFSRFYWYAYDHPTIGTLLNTPAGRAYSVTKRWMLGATMVEPCGRDRSDIWRCELRSAAGARVLAAWSLKEGVRLDIGSAKSIGNIAGGEVPIVGREVELGKAPVFLEFAQ